MLQMYKSFFLTSLFLLGGMVPVSAIAGALQGTFYNRTSFQGNYEQHIVNTPHDGKMTQTDIKLKFLHDTKNEIANYKLMSYGTTNIKVNDAGYITATSLTNSMNGHMSITYIVPSHMRLVSLGTVTLDFNNSKTTGFDYSDYEEDIDKKEKNKIIEDILTSPLKVKTNNNDMISMASLFLAIQPNESRRICMHAFRTKYMHEILNPLQDNGLKKIIQKYVDDISIAGGK